MLNAWHDIPSNKKSPKEANFVVEIPKDSKTKYELDKYTGLLKLDRFLYSAVHYPGDYGFIPQTLAEDNDPLDMIVLTTTPLYPMTLAEVRVIGVLRMIDGNEKDDKIIGVYKGNPRYDEFKNISDIPRHVKEELKHFFSTYKELQGKKCKVLSILDKKHAFKEIISAEKRYRKEILHLG